MDSKPVDILIDYPLTDEQVRSLEQISDNVRISHFPGQKFEEIPAEDKEKAEVLLTSKAEPSPEEMPGLQWIQYSRAGISFMDESPLLERDGFRATSLSGAVSLPVAEYAVGMMLALGHKLPQGYVYQDKKVWPPDRWERFQPRELRGSTVGLIGYGSIGREIARLLQPFKVEILATKKDLMSVEYSGYMPEGTGDREGLLFRRLYPPEAIKSMLSLCDFVVVCVPLTDETEGIIGMDELGAMKKTAYLVAVGRGGQVDEAALASALREKRITGAALDVFESEPLPKESPLWEVPNLVITPHIAGNTARYPELVFELFSANLKRYLKGDRLFNTFDAEKGY